MFKISKYMYIGILYLNISDFQTRRQTPRPDVFPVLGYSAVWEATAAGQHQQLLHLLLCSATQALSAGDRVRGLQTGGSGEH